MSTYDFCNNCGKTGHVYHQCKKPITSTGIILFRKNNKTYEYLMICRKDTLGYVDFLRGKYPIYNKFFIKNLINEMTEEEKEKIMNTPFKELWKKLWGDRVTMQYKNEEKMSEDKFNLLKYGVNCRDDKYNLSDIINYSNTSWNEPEWGFPKGRRNHMENDLNCAIREFEEETGVNRDNIDLIKNLLPVEEIFTGSNLKSYKHKYYLANIKSNHVDTYNYKKTELSKMKWFSLEECKKTIRPYNFERIELIEQVDKIIHKYSLI